MTTSDPIKLKFRVTSRDDAARRWSEKWGVALASNEEFHVTDQLLKLPFSDKKPTTLCVFSVPEGELKFRMLDTDRIALLNGVETRETIVGLGDRIELAEMVTIEVITGPARKLSAAEQEGPAVRKASGEGADQQGGEPHLNDPGDVPPMAMADEDGPTLTLSPIELAAMKNRIDRKARSFSRPVASDSRAAESVPRETPIELEDVPHARKDDGINPDHVKDDRPADPSDARKVGLRPTQRMTGTRSPESSASALKNAPLQMAIDDEGEARVLRREDLSRSDMILPTEGIQAATVAAPAARAAAPLAPREDYAPSPAPAASRRTASPVTAAAPQSYEPSTVEEALQSKPYPQSRARMAPVQPMETEPVEGNGSAMPTAVEDTGRFALPVAEASGAPEPTSAVRYELTHETDYGAGEDSPAESSEIGIPRKKRTAAAAPALDAPPGDQWVPEVEPVSEDAIDEEGHGRKKKFLIAAGVMVLLGPVAALGWKWGGPQLQAQIQAQIQQMFQRGESAQNSPPAATSTIHIEPLSPGISVNELKKKVEEIKRRQSPST